MSALKILCPEQMKPRKLNAEMITRRKQGEIVTIRSHIADKYDQYYPANPSLGLEKYFKDLGIDIKTIRAKNFWDLEEFRDMQVIFPEMILSVIWQQIEKIFDYKKLLAFITNTTADTVTIPYSEEQQTKKVIGKDLHVPIGVQFDESTVEFNQKKIDIFKFGQYIKIPYEYFKDVPFPLLATKLKQIGNRIAADLRAYVLYVMIHGDGGRGQNNTQIEDTAGSVGVKSTSAGIQFYDIQRLSTRMFLKGCPATNMIADETQYNDIKTLPEYSDKAQGTPKIILEEEEEITTPRRMHPAVDNIGTKKLLLISKDFCTGMFSLEGFQVEQDKIISRQIHEATCWLRCGFGNIDRKARCLIDGGTAYSTQGFPDYLAHLQAA
ncbi:MAG: hypothetical protein PVH61_13880 [Candidatus Aminicenantes bacterium]|jgi:hypothetical protein